MSEILVEYTSPDFPTKETYGEHVALWRQRYDALLAALGAVGTEVVRSRTLERDQDVPPSAFVRSAVHEIIFPPQDTAVAADRSRVIDGDPDYGLDREDWVRGYDSDRVEGHIRVTYDDAVDRVACVVTDRLSGGSILPPEAHAALVACMAPVGVEPVAQPVQ